MCMLFLAYLFSVLAHEEKMKSLVLNCKYFLKLAKSNIIRLWLEIISFQLVKERTVCFTVVTDSIWLSQYKTIFQFSVRVRQGLCLTCWKTAVCVPINSWMLQGLCWLVSFNNFSLCVCVCMCVYLCLRVCERESAPNIISVLLSNYIHNSNLNVQGPWWMCHPSVTCS